MPCSQVDLYRYVYYPENGVSTILQNCNEDVPDYMVSSFRRHYIFVIFDELYGVFTVLSVEVGWAVWFWFVLQGI
jgi:hypothetical protein